MFDTYTQNLKYRRFLENRALRHSIKQDENHSQLTRGHRYFSPDNPLPLQNKYFTEINLTFSNGMVRYSEALRYPVLYHKKKTHWTE